MLSSALTDTISALNLNLTRYPRPTKVPFCSRKLSTRKGVFDPSFGLTTKYLIETVCSGNYRVKNAFDMGCGIGAIAIALAENEIADHVTGFEYNATAYKNAVYNHQNRCSKKERLKIVHSNLFEPVSPQLHFQFNDPYFDLGVFNHSYLPESEAQNIWHPQDQPGGYELIRRFLTVAPRYVVRGGRILMPYSPFVAGSIHSPTLVADELNLSSRIVREFTDKKGSHQIIEITIY